MLLEHGADIEAKTRNGETVLGLYYCQTCRATVSTFLSFAATLAIRFLLRLSSWTFIVCSQLLNVKLSDSENYSLFKVSNYYEIRSFTVVTSFKY